MKGLLGGLLATSLGLVLMAALLVAGVGQPEDVTRRGLRPGTVPAAYQPLVERAGALCDAVTPALLAAQLEAESAWNPRAVSRSGAQGIAQFMPGTWRTWGRDGNGDGTASPWDPADAIPAQAALDCRLAAEMADAVADGRVRGDVSELMLASYNAGSGAVLAARGVPGIDETRTYVAKITQRLAAFTAPSTNTPPTNTPPTNAPPANGPADDAPPGNDPVAPGFASRFIAAARSQTGVPYVWGGGSYSGPTDGGLDCSGLVLYAAYQASDGRLRLPHSADAQVRAGTPVPLGRLQPGDVISFTARGSTVAHHIGIYLGGGLMLHAPQTGSTVRTAELDAPYWTAQQWRATRYA